MNNYRRYNNLIGWLVFSIAAVVYLLTIESTASFWDCGEFIAASYKQMIGHPPGAPFFLIIGRVFSLLAFSNKELVPVMINSLSALASAFTILFLFWTITYLVKKILISSEEDYTPGRLIAIFGSGAVGALAYTFSDTFWFSAVEGEVYASSSLFTAFVFWAILKWEETADQPYANRWLVLIAYLMGLSIGVHLLNLLAIPAIVFVYYFKKYPVTRKGIFAAGIIAILILGAIMYGIIQGAVKVATVFELFFVNGLGLPLHSGLYFYLLLLAGLLTYGIWITFQKQKVLWNTILTCIAVLLMGYSSYAMIMIRSNACPPMNQNAPDNLFSLLYYLNREQYGDRPLFYGQNYNSPILDLKETSPVYAPVNGRYEIVHHKQEYKYDERTFTFFPRMYSPEADHVKAYESWITIKGRPVTIEENGTTKTIKVPTVSDNIAFFLRYQLGFMYFRYFMWNFAGRQNDLQGNGELTKGNWICGIPFIDNARLGPQENLPDYLKNNRAHNVYYMLPLLLGLLGMIFHYLSDKKNFTVVFLLFFMTGIAIVLYLNQTPYQPRERDYAYAGSFYAFAIWIGTGTTALIHYLTRKSSRPLAPLLITFALLMAVPGLMAKENWDDHDRSGRYTARDFAFDYLNSCDSNAILFTNGDNDTFPLWYAQEVEGIRTDVRVVNLSYLSAEWYISQMRRKAYLSDPIRTTLTPADYAQGKNDVIYLLDRSKEYVPLQDAMAFIKSNDPRKYQSIGTNQNYLPTNRLKLTIDPNQPLASGIVDSSAAHLIVNEMQWQIKRSYLTKSDLMILDILLANQWKRPVYYAVTVSRENYLGLENYFFNCGLAYRIVPVIASGSETGTGGIDTKKMYNNLMNKFRWGNATDPHVYLDENNVRMFSNMRLYFADLASALIREGKMDSARKVLNRCIEVVPAQKVPHNYFSLALMRNLYRVGEYEKADSLVRELSLSTFQEIYFAQKLPRSFYSSGNSRKRIGYKLIMGDSSAQGYYAQGEIQLHLYIAGELIRLTHQFGRTELNKDLQQKFMPYMGNM